MAALECIITAVTEQPSPRLWSKYDGCWKKQRISTSFVPDAFPCAEELYNIQVLVHNYSTCRRSLFCVQMSKPSSMQAFQVSSLGKLSHHRKARFRMSHCELTAWPQNLFAGPTDEVDGTICSGKLLERLWNRNEKLLSCTLSGWSYGWTNTPGFLL